MRVVIQRVSEASVSICEQIHASIEKGFLVFLGIEETDTMNDIDWLTRKIVQLRIFSDKKGLMNESIIENSGNMLIISQFTLYAQVRKGNRPSFIKAARPETAIPLYESFCKQLKLLLGADRIMEGVFGADMQVSLVNDGPVTICIDTKNIE